MKYARGVTSDVHHSAERELLRAALSLDLSVEAPDLTPTTDATNMVVRIRGRFGGHDEDAEEGYESWGAFPLIYAIGALSFVDAGPRGDSTLDFESEDVWRAADMLECLRYVRGELHFYADYVRGRCMKTRIIVKPSGDFEIETVNRGDAATRWVAQITGANSAVSSTAN
jgi:hypothetical protein